MRLNSRLVLVLSSFIFGIFITLISVRLLNQQRIDTPGFIEKRETGYQFINPLLECEDVNSIGDMELRQLQQNIEKYIQNYDQVKVGVYYRDLNNGPWFGINEDQQFSPQSLLKLPVALAYYKLAENNPQILDEELMYETEIEHKNLDDNLELHKKYHVTQLMHRMLVLSDNVAFNLLTMRLPKKYIKKVHQDLEISYPEEGTPDDFMSVKSYASIFRVLFNSSYLPRRYSELMLNILSESTFIDGLVAGVDADVPVAHKFGILNSENSQYESQLHDCGIIYLPEKPYLLCVMTKGNDQEQLEKIIKEISATVFDEVSRSVVRE